MYYCPMHPEVRSEVPGTCPKCGGMKLVPEKSVATKPAGQDGSYWPLAVIIGLILLTTFAIEFPNFLLPSFISNFMAGFFIVFAGFKLIDLKGFAHGYQNYDLIAQRIPAYAYLYPFIELFFGLAMIAYGDLRWLLIAEIIVMIISGLGVVIKMLKHEKVQCVCLGTILKVPLTSVTLIEDFGMAALASLLLIL